MARKQDNGLSVKDNAILRFLIEFEKENGYKPSVREITSHCDISSTSIAEYHLEKLQGLGHIHRPPKIARAITVTETGLTALQSHGKDGRTGK